VLCDTAACDKAQCNGNLLSVMMLSVIMLCAPMMSVMSPRKELVDRTQKYHDAECLDYECYVILLSVMSQELEDKNQ